MSRPVSLTGPPRRSRPMDGVGGEHLAEEQGGSFARMLRYLAAAPPPRSLGKGEGSGHPAPGPGRQSGAGWRCCRLLGGASRRARAARGPPERPMLDALKVLFVLTGASTYLGGRHFPLPPARKKSFSRRPVAECADAKLLFKKLRLTDCPPSLHTLCCSATMLL